MIIEDLLAIAPEYVGDVSRLVQNHNLTFGPYYCQPDWQLSSGELLIRNLLYGRKDATAFGRTTQTGWLVDTFGHISQSPQIHLMFGIDAVYVWRGVPQLAPYFHWQAADGSQVLAINLFGGYRNLYGLNHAPEVAVRRLTAEIKKLQPFYPTADLPLFDGYDLEDDPEDPLTFLKQNGSLPHDDPVQEATPESFAETIKNNVLDLPKLTGELNSGKFGATFPGTFSTRTYLKLMARDCESLLFQLCEPLAVLAYLKGQDYDEAKYENWSRLLLQNAVHDCLCGVSIDQVHEKMEVNYRRVFDGAKADIQQSLAVILADFAPGTYVVSTSPFSAEFQELIGDELFCGQTVGFGIFPVTKKETLQESARSVTSFRWGNSHYKAQVNSDGHVQIGAGVFGQLVVRAEHGDTYSDEPGEELCVIRPKLPLTVERESDNYAVIRFEGGWESKDIKVSATVRLIFDASPLVRWEIDLDSQGADMMVEMIFATARTGEVYAGMPFDIVKRPFSDTDLLPETLPDDLSGVLLGQRELNAVSSFPFQGFVAVGDEDGCTAVLAKGLRAYSASEDGAIRLPLRRSVEWLTRSNLKNRIGDAGPFFYVPDARCERKVRHELAVVVGNFSLDSAELMHLTTSFQTPPLLVRKLNEGTVTSWPVLKEDLPLSCIFIQNGNIFGRFFNPTTKSIPLSKTYQKTDVWGDGNERVGSILPKEIVTFRLALGSEEKGKAAIVKLLNPPVWRIGTNSGKPDPAIITELEQKIDYLDKELAEVSAGLPPATSEDRLRREHKATILGRERLEYLLSRTLNERKLADYPSSYLFEYDEEIAKIGTSLNRMRIRRRIFDYVREVL